MVSSISTLSIFILVLISGYFTLPIDNDFTAETSFKTPTILDDGIDTTQINEIKRSVDEHVGSDVSGTTVESETTEHKGRMFEDSFTTEDSMHKRTVEDSFTSEPTIEHKERIVEDSFTSEPTIEHKERMVGESFTSEPIEHKERTVEDSFTSEPTIEHKERMVGESFTFEPTTEDSMQKREFELEHTTATLPTETDKVSTSLFTSTSSAVAPGLYVRGSTDFSPLQMTKQKYVGSLPDDEEHETEGSHDSDRKHQTEEEVEKPKHTKPKTKKQDDEEVEGLQNEEVKPKLTKSKGKTEDDEEEKPKPKLTKPKTKTQDDEEVEGLQNEEVKPKLTKPKTKKQGDKKVEDEKTEDHLNEEEKTNSKEHDEELNIEQPSFKPKGEEEKQSRVEEKISKKPSSSSSSDNESTESTDDKKYAKAKLSDEKVPTRFFPQTLNSRVAIYDSNDDVPSKTNKPTKAKLTQGKESSQAE